MFFDALNLWVTPFLLFFQIYDYAQYYLDLADANRKVAEATLNEANGLDPANRYIMKKFCMRIITDQNIKCQAFTHMADSRYKMQKNRQIIWKWHFWNFRQFFYKYFKVDFRPKPKPKKDLL